VGTDPGLDPRTERSRLQALFEAFRAQAFGVASTLRAGASRTAAALRAGLPNRATARRGEVSPPPTRRLFHFPSRGDIKTLWNGLPKTLPAILRLLGVRLAFAAQMAAHGVLSNPLRSGLTILGVAIGVASVVSLMGVGEGARQAIMEQFNSLGSNVVVIEAQDPSLSFDPGEAEELVERVPSLVMATPVVETETLMRFRRARGPVEVLGVNEQFPLIRDHPLASGRFFTEYHVELRSPVAVLGYNLASSLLYGRDPVGLSCIVDGRTYRIIGVLEKKGEGQAEGIDDKVVIPYTSAQQIAEVRTVREIWGKAASSVEADLAVVQLGRIFRRKLGLDPTAPTRLPPSGGEPGSGEPGLPGGPGGEGSVGERPGEGRPPGGGQPPGNDSSPLSGGKTLMTITSLNRLVKEADKANRVMTLLLGGIAAVSLLVGGLGVMNIMLVAVTERTGEIGVRRALGAKKHDLLAQFMLEALYLTTAGALAGVVAGIWAISIFERRGLEAVVSLLSIEVAAGVALGTGLLFGVYPAFTASSVPPVDALRRQ